MMQKVSANDFCFIHRSYLQDSSFHAAQHYYSDLNKLSQGSMLIWFYAQPWVFVQCNIRKP
jgi:hypothetical protein